MKFAIGDTVKIVKDYNAEEYHQGVSDYIGKVGIVRHTQVQGVPAPGNYQVSLLTSDFPTGHSKDVFTDFGRPESYLTWFYDDELAKVETKSETKSETMSEASEEKRRKMFEINDKVQVSEHEKSTHDAYIGKLGLVTAVTTPGAKKSQEARIRFLNVDFSSSILAYASKNTGCYHFVWFDSADLQLVKKAAKIKVQKDDTAPDVRDVQVGDIVRMRPDNDDLAHVAGIVGIIAGATKVGEFIIHAKSRQFSPHVNFEDCPFAEDSDDTRVMWACLHEFTLLD
ncbi:hypothetical protein LCGC14_1848510 [marine sediment metagenome]|uniref:Uncharacterized protein n=1 Tax=marine sediment metagenome TaxID=412755 RepID=A0A0F9IQM4_9ZZZZ